MDPKGIKPIAEKANVSVEKLKELYKLLQQDLEWISQRSAIQVNKKRSKGPDLKEGGMVYLLRKNIKTKRPSNKLDHTKLGPYKIKRKLGPVTYELEMPEGMRIHPRFHISLLEPASKNARPGPVEIDPETQDPLYEIDRLVGFKKEQQSGANKAFYLVHWKGYQNSEDTWEPEENLPRESIRRYHAANKTVMLPPAMRHPNQSPEPRTRQNQDRPRRPPGRYQGHP